MMMTMKLTVLETVVAMAVIDRSRRHGRERERERVSGWLVSGGGRVGLGFWGDG